jgi:hypothetical protein
MPDMTKETRTKITRVLALVFSVGLTLALYVFHDKLRDFAHWISRIFILSFITNATLILPVRVF